MAEDERRKLSYLGFFLRGFLLLILLERSLQTKKMVK